MKFFNLDSPLMKFLSRMTDILWLNVLTLVCVILVIPAGAGFTALHYVCLKMVRDEEGYITKDFFKSFKTNFKQSTVIWLISVLVACVLAFDYKALMEIPTGRPVIFAAITAASIFIFMTFLYVFPVLSHFENTIRGTIKNAFFMSILALPKTILMALLTALPLALIYMVERFQTAAWIIPLTVLFWFSAPAYFSAKLYSTTFKKFEPETSKTEVDDFAWTVSETDEENKTEENEMEEIEEKEEAEN